MGNGDAGLGEVGRGIGNGCGGVVDELSWVDPGMMKRLRSWVDDCTDDKECLTVPSCKACAS